MATLRVHGVVVAESRSGGMRTTMLMFCNSSLALCVNTDVFGLSKIFSCTNWLEIDIIRPSSSAPVDGRICGKLCINKSCRTQRLQCYYQELSACNWQQLEIRGKLCMGAGPGRSPMVAALLGHKCEQLLQPFSELCKNRQAKDFVSVQRVHCCHLGKAGPDNRRV